MSENLSKSGLNKLFRLLENKFKKNNSSSDTRSWSGSWPGLWENKMERKSSIINTLNDK